jgi:helicase
VRIKHGVKNELLELVSLPGIGRVRGRSLWNHGVRSLKDIEEASVEELSRIPGIGRKLAEKIKKSLSGVSSSSEK